MKNADIDLLGSFVSVCPSCETDRFKPVGNRIKCINCGKVWKVIDLNKKPMSINRFYGL
jgi:ribosomal protein L37AE/L43A